MASECSDYMVIVSCMTYNHAEYIKEALNGFAIQETSFSYVCVVVDDCSTDGEQEVIREWMRSGCQENLIRMEETDLFFLFVVRHKNNENCTFAFYLLKQNLFRDIERKESIIESWRLRSKYEAICEGDDYWTDSRKLQKQIDFLEKNPNYSATTSNALVLRGNSSSQKPFRSAETKDFTRLKEIIDKRQFHTASVVFRLSMMRQCPYKNRGYWDTFIWCCLLTQGPIHYDGETTCVYRKQQQGITESTPRIGWLKLNSDWADILLDCYVPHYVKRKYVVRSVTRDSIRIYIRNRKQLKPEEREEIKSIYWHNFALGNLFSDIKEAFIQCVKMILK